MKTNLLKEGDVIKLKKGMEVYAQIPEMFVFSNRKTNKEFTESAIVVGKIYSNNINIDKNINKVTEGIVERFDWEGFNLKLEDAKEFVLSKIKQPKKEKFIFNEGEFVVIKTEYTGGGTGMGPHDVYPDGHKVYCKRLKNGKFDENGIEISFYQSGSFSAMIRDIKPIRKLKMKFV